MELVGARPARAGAGGRAAAKRGRGGGQRAMSGTRVRLAILAILPIVAAACGGPILANAPAPHPIVTPAPSPSARPADPQPIVLPRDDAPHDRLTEWWYYTGHLRDEAGGRWGFEYVVFRAERGGFPVSWASHLALTDETSGAFHYAQRAEIGAQVDLATAGPDPGSGVSPGAGSSPG